MHRILTVLLIIITVVSMAGCKKQSVPTPTPTPSAQAEMQSQAPSGAEAVEPTKRVDVLGNEITTGYADGTFQKAENGTMFVECGDGQRTFLLSERAQREISVLEISEGQRIIINYNTIGDGIEEAESIEKIISEEPSAITMQ